MYIIACSLFHVIYLYNHNVINILFLTQNYNLIITYLIYQYKYDNY